MAMFRYLKISEFNPGMAKQGEDILEKGCESQSGVVFIHLKRISFALDFVKEPLKFVKIQKRFWKLTVLFGKSTIRNK